MYAVNVMIYFQAASGFSLCQYTNQLTNTLSVLVNKTLQDIF